MPKDGASVERAQRMRWSLLLLPAWGVCLGADPLVEPDQFLPGLVSGTQILRPAMPPAIFGQVPPDQSAGIPNLEAPGNPSNPRLGMEVQAGVKLLSNGCTVTSSGGTPVRGELSLITDGDRFGQDGYFVELPPGKQWVQIDLKQSQRLHLIWLWRYFKLSVIFRDTVIQISDDPGFKTSTTVFNADHDNSSGLGAGKDEAYYETNYGRAIAFTPVAGRYVRLWSSGADLLLNASHYIEVSVYGEPPAPAAK